MENPSPSLNPQFPNRILGLLIALFYFLPWLSFFLFYSVNSLLDHRAYSQISAECCSPETIWRARICWKLGLKIPWPVLTGLPLDIILSCLNPSSLKSQCSTMFTQDPTPILQCQVNILWGQGGAGHSGNSQERPRGSTQLRVHWRGSKKRPCKGAAEMSREFHQRGERKDIWSTEENLREADVASRRKFVFLHRFSLACLLNSSFLFKRKSYN